MFKVEMKLDTVKLQASLKKAIDEKVIKSQKLNSAIGQYVADQIRDRAKFGRPLNTQGKFGFLAPSSIARRKFLAKHNVTDPQFNANRRKSNLTITGQYLNSMTYKLITTGGVEVGPKGPRKPYRGPRGPYKLSHRARTNEDLHLVLEEIGFRAFTKQGIERALLANLTRLVNREVRLALAQTFKK